MNPFDDFKFRSRIGLLVINYRKWEISLLHNEKKQTRLRHGPRVGRYYLTQHWRRCRVDDFLAGERRHMGPIK